MANGKIRFGKQSGGELALVFPDGISNTEVMLPESGNLVSVNTAVTDNAIARYDGTTGKVQNSGVTIDDNGNVGIGVTPSAWRTEAKAVQLGASGSIESLTNHGSYVSLNANNYNNGLNDTYINTAAVTKYQQLLGVHRWYTAPAGTAGNPITWTTSMMLDTSSSLLTYGSVMCGFNGFSFQPSGSTAVTSYGGDGNNYIQIVGRNTSGGNYTVLDCISNGARRAAILDNGAYQSAINVYGATSDIKLKENIVDATPKLDKLMQVKVRNFNYIGQEDKQIGVIAQEIEKIFPSIVFETKDTKKVEVEKEREITLEDGTIEIEKYTETETVETGEVTKNVKYSVIYMMMLKAMQEQQEIINDLKERIEILEAK